jgi:hypothetical protein
MKHGRIYMRMKDAWGVVVHDKPPFTEKAKSRKKERLVQDGDHVHSMRSRIVMRPGMLMALSRATGRRGSHLSERAACAE